MKRTIVDKHLAIPVQIGYPSISQLLLPAALRLRMSELASPVCVRESPRRSSFSTSAEDVQFAQKPSSRSWSEGVKNRSRISFSSIEKDDSVLSLWKLLVGAGLIFIFGQTKTRTLPFPLGPATPGSRRLAVLDCQDRKEAAEKREEERSLAKPPSAFALRNLLERKVFWLPLDTVKQQFCRLEYCGEERKDLGITYEDCVIDRVKV